MDFADKIRNYLKASYPILYIQSHEEKRVCKDIYEAFKDKDSTTLYEWDMKNQLQRREKDGQLTNCNIASTDVKDVIDTIAKMTNEGRNVFILKDYHPFIEVNYAVRSLRNAIDPLKGKGNMIVFVSPVVKIPTELEKDIQLLDYKLPDQDAVKNQLEFVHRSVIKKNPNIELADPIKQTAIEAARGMTASEIQNAFTLAIVTHQKFDKNFVNTVFDEKVIQVKKSGLLQYIEPDVDFSKVGGLDSLKDWMRVRAKALTPEARDYGLPYPKGALLCGVPGCGKSLIAKAVAKEFGLPLFALDIGGLFGKHVGETEENFRRMVAIVENIGSCILYIDEFEKALNRDAVSGKGDTGTSSRAFATLLTWLNDHTSPVFVIGTSNNHTILPPELTRKGRFDEMFWIDLPSAIEREDIFRVLLTRYKRDPLKFNITELAKRAVGFTGSEIENTIKSAMFNCFADKKRDVNTTAILDEVVETIPFSKTNELDLSNMRQQAKGKLRFAAGVDQSNFETALRKIDITK